MSGAPILSQAHLSSGTRPRRTAIHLLAAVTVLTWLGSTLMGCGSQQFELGEIDEPQAAPGDFIIPAKVDILLAEDNSGSIYEAFDEVKAQIPGFLDKLEDQGWNYRFATIPLIDGAPITEIMASKFDGNWAQQGLWKKPHPASQLGDPGLSVLPDLFRTRDDYNSFITINQVTNGTTQYEPGFDNILNALFEGATPRVQFLRPDALLVVIVLGNGQDTSWAYRCIRNDGFQTWCYVDPNNPPPLGTVTVPYDPRTNQINQQINFDFYRSEFQALLNQGTSADLKFFAAVSSRRSTNCLGGTSFVGTRYHDMANAFNGGIYDICSQPITSVLDGIGQNLHNTRLSYVARYLVLENKPQPDTIRVTKFIGGDPDQPVELSNDPNNGFTYVGYQSAYQIESPVELNYVTGHLIELHGSAKLVGADTATVTFIPSNE